MKNETFHFYILRQWIWTTTQEKDDKKDKESQN